ncbi:hypothetical protein HID58_040007, partial [Brassica napus]
PKTKPVSKNRSKTVSNSPSGESLVDSVVVELQFTWPPPSSSSTSLLLKACCQKKSKKSTIISRHHFLMATRNDEELG